MKRMLSLAGVVCLVFASTLAAREAAVQLPGPGVTIPVDVDGDGKASLGDSYVLNLWLEGGGSLSTALSASRSAGKYLDMSGFFADQATGNSTPGTMAAGAGGGPGAGTTTRIEGVDQNGNPVEPDDDSRDARITPDGRYVVFASKATNMIDGVSVPAGVFQVYRYDRNAAPLSRMALVSWDSVNGAAAASNCLHPSISDGGQRVAFDSLAFLDPDDDNRADPQDAGKGEYDVYVRDLGVGRTVLLTAETDPNPDPVRSFAPCISSDGRRVVFTSSEKMDDNTLPPVNSKYEVYSVDLSADFGDPGQPDWTARTIQSYTPPVPSGNGQLFDYMAGTGLITHTESPDSFLTDAEIESTVVGDVIDATGDAILFQARAAGWIGNDCAPAWRVYLRDLPQLESVFANAGDPPTADDGEAVRPTMSRDGSRVAYENLPDPTGIYDIFVRDVGGPPGSRTFTTFTRVEGFDSAREPMLSSDGNLVVLNSVADFENFGPDSEGNSHVFALDVSTPANGTIVRVSVDSAGVKGSGGSSRNADVGAISADEDIAVFESAAVNLLGPGVDTNQKTDIFIRTDDLTVTEFLFVRGDADSDSSVNISDTIQIYNYLFSGGAAPACMDAADSNDDGSVNITDGVLISNWLFAGGQPPAEPTPSIGTYPSSDCGVDPTSEVPDLGCETQAGTCSP